MGLSNANQRNKKRSEEFESKGSTLFVNVALNNHLMSFFNAQLSQTELVRLFQY